MAKWYDVKYDFPSMDVSDRITCERTIQDWFMENNIDVWYHLRDSVGRMCGFAFEHERDAIMFSLRWL
jgi:hypothetical protein